MVKEWDGGAYNYPFSFFITEIEGGVVKGKFNTWEVAYPDSYQYKFASWLGDLTGIISNGVVKCQLDNECGDNGKATLVFKETDVIEAAVEFTSQKGLNEYETAYENYLFRPHNFKDIETNIKVLIADAFITELDSWGSINFVTALLDTGRVWYPATYLTDEHNNILYKINAPFQTASKIIDVKINDINGDGLKDVTMITGFIDYETGLIMSDMPQNEWGFFQMHDGTFFSNSLECLSASPPVTSDEK